MYSDFTNMMGDSKKAGEAYPQIKRLTPLLYSHQEW